MKKHQKHGGKTRGKAGSTKFSVNKLAKSTPTDYNAIEPIVWLPFQFDAAMDGNIPPEMEELPDEPPEFRGRSNAEVFELACIFMEECARRAMKTQDKYAAQCLLGIARLAVENLYGLAWYYPKTLLDFSSKCEEWPALVSTHPGADRANQELLKKLQVGEKPITPVKLGARCRTDTLANITVLKALYEIHRDIFLMEQAERRLANPGKSNWDNNSIEVITLPSLSLKPEVITKWFKVIWSYVKEDHDGKPEKNPKLWGLGVHNAGKDVVGKNFINSKPLERKEVRDGISKVLKTAFRRLVKAGAIPPRSPTA